MSQIQFTHSGQRYVLGQVVTDFYGVWDRQSPKKPIRKFPFNQKGWDEALAAFHALEPSGQPVKAPEINVDQIEILAGDLDRPYDVIGPVKARVGAATAFSKTPTLEDVNFKLREEAIKLGANAVINVTYERGVSATSWKAFTALGTAVFTQSTEVKCPFCAELIKREAIKCKHCGSDLREASSQG